MRDLTGKERLLRTLRGEPIDRVPVSPRVFPNVVYEYHNSSDVDYLEGSIEYARHFAFDIMEWTCTAPWDDFKLDGPNWQPVVRKETSGKTTHEIVTVKTPRGELRQVHSTTQTGRWESEAALTEFPIKSERELDLFVEYQPPVPAVDTSLIARAKELIGDDGIVTPCAPGPFNILARRYRKLDDLLLDIQLRPDFYRRMMEYFLQRIERYAEQVIAAGPPMVDIGANVANGRLVGADFWAEHMLPYENRLADYFQDRGVAALFHQCGYAAGHLHVYPRLHHRAWGYLAPAPHGDVVLEEAIAKLPRTMILWGHLDQIDFLRKATPLEVERRVRQILETVKPRGNFILGTTDYLEVNTPPDNIRALVDAAHKYGRYDDWRDDSSSQE